MLQIRLSRFFLSFVLFFLIVEIKEFWEPWPMRVLAFEHAHMLDSTIINVVVIVIVINIIVIVTVRNCYSHRHHHHHHNP